MKATEKGAEATMHSGRLLADGQYLIRLKSGNDYSNSWEYVEEVYDSLGDAIDAEECMDLEEGAEFDIVNHKGKAVYGGTIINM